MPSARFQVDPRLATLLGEAYRSSEHALKELIDNAWDADATRVEISLPDPMSGNPIVVKDNGTGMTPRELESEYLVIASDRRSRKGEFTVGRHRSVKGRKGIGKFAGLMAADTMLIETTARGQLTRVRIRREDLQPGAGDLEQIDLPLEIVDSPPERSGTAITLSGLNQAFDAPTPDRLRPLLILEYGRQEDFELLVNGVALGVDDIPGRTFSHEAELASVGRASLRFTVSDGTKGLRQAGIAVRVTGKIIGRPTFFGLDDDEEIPPKLLKKLYGELIADGLAEDVTADWGAVIENSLAFATASRWAAQAMKQALSEVFANEVQLAKARRIHEIHRRLEHLPEHRRAFAETKIERVLTKFYGEREERIDTVVAVTLDAIEFDEYFAAVQAIEQAEESDLATFAQALQEFGLVDMANMADQAQKRLAVLDHLDRLLDNALTREADIHTALERNLWVFGSDYSTLSSNRTLRKIIERYTNQQFTGARATQRPDLLLTENVSGRHVLIEFKRPSLDITREHEAQATTYRDELRHHFENIEVVLVGRAQDSRSDSGYRPPGMTVLSYASVVSRARTELTWLIKQLGADTGRGLARSE